MATRPLQSLSLRQKIVTRLRGDGALIAIGTPALDERIYEVPPVNPTWPWVRYGGPGETPIRKGTSVRFTIHTFSKAQFSDESANLNGGVQASLEDAVIELSPGVTARIVWLGSQILPDPQEIGAHHGVNDFRATIG
jgi:hypothetical protein